jgi:WD40 repeat protein
MDDERDPLTLDWAGSARQIIFDSTGEHVLTPGFGDKFAIVPTDGGPPRMLEGFSRETMNHGAAFSPNERLVASAWGFGGEQRVLRVWDLEYEHSKVFDLEKKGTDSASQAHETWMDSEGVYEIAFLDESTVITAGANGVQRWNVTTGESSHVVTSPLFCPYMDMAADRRTAVVHGFFGRPSDGARGQTMVLDLATGEKFDIRGFGREISCVAISRDGEIVVTGDAEGFVHVGRRKGGPPQLLLGHTARIEEVAISPDLKWVASSSQDETLRLWPMPDLSKPPLHTLPREELIAKLKSLTNLRAVRDEESSTGWKIEVGPFPGWAEVPEW